MKDTYPGEFKDLSANTIVIHEHILVIEKLESRPKFAIVGKCNHLGKGILFYHNTVDLAESNVNIINNKLGGHASIIIMLHLNTLHF